MGKIKQSFIVRLSCSKIDQKCFAASDLLLRNTWKFNFPAAASSFFFVVLPSALKVQRMRWVSKKKFAAFGANMRVYRPSQDIIEANLYLQTYNPFSYHHITCRFPLLFFKWPSLKVKDHQHVGAQTEQQRRERAYRSVHKVMLQLEGDEVLFFSLRKIYIYSRGPL